jgi:putative membrane protein
MSNAFAIFRRDLMRLLRVPAAWVILFGLVFLPPLYAWFNIIGFWNPYGNTHGIHVAVANEDQGADNDVMGRIELGNQIVSQLKTDNTLGWRFVSQPEAMRQVYSGDSYAAIIIPKDFSRQISDITTGAATESATASAAKPGSQAKTDSPSKTKSRAASTRPTLEYYVNEKKNGIATKITDTGANTVDRRVNDAFVSAVSKAISSATNNAASAINAQTDSTTNQTLRDLRTAKQDITDIRAVIAHLRTMLAAGPTADPERTRGTAIGRLGGQAGRDQPAERIETHRRNAKQCRRITRFIVHRSRSEFVAALTGQWADQSHGFLACRTAHPSERQDRFGA